MTEEKKSKNPFVAAMKAVPKAPGAKTAPVQQAKFKPQVGLNKPAKRTAGRGR
jgi:hypothetical protein